MKSASTALLVLCLTTTAFANDWPEWRGPGGLGLAAAGNYPIQISPVDNLLWKRELPGRGSSTPAVWGERIFVTCPIDGQDGVLCFNFAGEELWRRQLGPESPGKHRNGSGSNPSPVTNGEKVVVYYKSGMLACLDFAGDVLWKINLQKKFGPDTLWWDLGTSPVLGDEMAVVAVMQAGDSYLVALDLSDGQVVWKRERMFQCAEESDQAYTTPVIRKLSGNDVIVTWGADHLTGHDLRSGKPLWKCGGFNPDNQGMWRVIASAATDGEVAVVPFGRGEFTAAVSLKDAKGDITDTHRLWEKAGLGTDVPTPLIHDDLLILLTDKGKVAGLNKMTGEQLWEFSLPRARAKYYASPILAGDLLYCAREDGAVMVVRLQADGPELLAENSLGEGILATPILLRDRLLIRGTRHLFLFGRQD